MNKITIELTEDQRYCLFGLVSEQLERVRATKVNHYGGEISKNREIAFNHRLKLLLAKAKNK